MSDTWQNLQAALTSLLAICEEEQHALIALDAPRLGPIQVRKAEQVRAVARCYKDIGEPEEGFPADVARLAERCQRTNVANRQMLLLTLRCIDNMLEGTRPRKPTYGPGDGLRRQIMDLKV